MIKKFGCSHARRLLVLLAFSNLVQCAHIGPSEESGLSFTDGDEEDIPPVPFQAKGGYAGFTMGPNKHQVKWLVCNHQSPLGAAVVVQGELPDFQDPLSCKEPIAQGFLSRGLSILLISRPASMGSTGQNDLGGPLTLAGVIAAIKSVVAQPQPELTGKIEVIWGYGSGAGIAALASRQIGGISSLILGGGFYDYEEVLTKSRSELVKKAIQQVKSMTGDKGIEFRSISYDISHLPKKISLYHGALDQVAPVGQARHFSDSLRTSGEYQVTFKILDQVDHWLKPIQHQHAILSLLPKPEAKD